MLIVNVPQRISLTPAPPKFARGPKPPSGRFKFDVISDVDIDPKEEFAVEIKVFVQANVKTLSGKKGIVEIRLFLDGKPGSRSKFTQAFDPLDFPPNQPLTVSETLIYQVENLKKVHQFTIEAGKNTQFDKSTVFEMHLEIMNVR